MARPYRHVSTGTLVKQHDELQERVYRREAGGNHLINGPERRALATLARELDKRRVKPVDPDPFAKELAFLGGH